MRIKLSTEELQLLSDEQIEADTEKEYSPDEALELLQEVYDIESMYSNLPDNDQRAGKANTFARLADKIYAMIPES